MTFPYTFQVAGTDIILLGPGIARIVLKVDWDASRAPNSDERIEVTRRTENLLRYLVNEGMMKPKAKFNFVVEVIN